MLEKKHLVGNVDDVGTSSISGWVTNLANPGDLESAVCRDATGVSVEFKAWHMREDVCRAFGHDARSGFVIPISSLAGLRSPITVCDRLGTVLPGGSEIIVPASGSPHSKTIIYLHIPKTAGTSVRNALISGLLPSERLFIYPPPFGLTFAEFASLPAEQRRAAKLIIGHAHYGLDRILEQSARYFTFVREPLARLKSHVGHLYRSGQTFRICDYQVDLRQVVEDGLDEQFDNLMIRVIAGLPANLVPLGAIGWRELAAARRIIRRDFDFVGLVETINEDMPRLQALLGRPLDGLLEENVDEHRVRSNEFRTTIDWSRVAWRNRYDRMLWDEVKLSNASSRSARP